MIQEHRRPDGSGHDLLHEPGYPQGYCLSVTPQRPTQQLMAFPGVAPGGVEREFENSRQDHNQIDLSSSLHLLCGQ